ncbi:MAG TPA: BON domain-containing protein [Thermoguttaceae bacterium]|nr:BON domain-containing protein [Thermoguttaceae bacterium]
MIELNPMDLFSCAGKNAVDGVATELRGEPIRGPTVRAAPSQLVGVGQKSADLRNTALLLLIQERLEIHPHFRGRASLLTIELIQETIILSGRLPSHYLKQLLQEAVKLVPGVVDIDNQVDVVWPGL